MTYKLNGWRKDKPDYRDFLYSNHLFRVTRLPPKIDLRSKCPPIQDQGELGSCTANSLSGALEFMRENVIDKKDISTFSRLFIYYGERVLEGDVNQDNGAELRDGIKFLASNGAPPESLWPYVESQFTTKPPIEAFNEAQKFRITSYYKLNSINDVKHCLSEGFPIALGFNCYSSLDSDLAASTGYVSGPNPGEQSIGGHAVLAVSYGKLSDFLESSIISINKLNPNESVIGIRNSWGDNWGLAGYFFMPESYFISDSSDMWTIRR